MLARRYVGWLRRHALGVLTLSGLILAGAIYLIAFLIANRYPEHALPLSSGPNLVLTVLAAWRWKPASIRYTEEERAERARRRQERSSS